MASVTRTTTWIDNQVLNASDLNAEFNNLLNGLNLVNADVSAGAAIVYSKLNLTGSIVNADIGASAAIASSKLAVPILKAASYTPAGAGTATLDLSTANFHKITMPAGNITIALSNETVNQAFIIRILQDGVGSRTVTWFTTIHWVAGVAPTLTTTGSRWDTFGFIVTSAGNYDGYIVGQNLS